MLILWLIEGWLLGIAIFLGENLEWHEDARSWKGLVKEAEFCEMPQGVCELLWLKMILETLKIKWYKLKRFYCNNRLTIRNSLIF